MIAWIQSIVYCMMTAFMAFHMGVLWGSHIVGFIGGLIVLLLIPDFRRINKEGRTL